jgi:L-alanine-DL-glutamate epimerase-like enolase superfamily enzyme
MAPSFNKLSISANELQIPLRHKFKHASAERAISESVIVEASRHNLNGIGEGCPRLYVTGETISSAMEWIDAVKPEIENGVSSLYDLRKWIADNSFEIDKNPAAWCAVEIACIDLFAKEAAQSIECLVGAPEIHNRTFQYTAVVSDGSPAAFLKTTLKYLAGGFSDFKMKISGTDADLKKIAYFGFLTRLLKRRATLRVDGNNLWRNDKSAGIQHLSRSRFSLSGVEEPFGSGAAKEMSELSSELNVPVILDESLCRVDDVTFFERFPGKWIGNVRVSKLGGIIRSLEVVKALKDHNWKVIVGAQVGESSILTRAALCVAAAADDSLIAQEGAFGTWLLSYDPVTPNLMFGWGGRLRWPPKSGMVEGLGLTMAKEGGVRQQ